MGERERECVRERERYILQIVPMFAFMRLIFNFSLDDFSFVDSHSPLHRYCSVEVR